MRTQTTIGKQVGWGLACGELVEPYPTNSSRTIILAIMVVLCICTAVQAKYSGGTGEPNDPYLIATAEDMNAVGANPDDWDAHFLLVADINLADYTGTQFNIIGEFRDNPFIGVFDGNGHKISNFTYTVSGIYFAGIFGYVDDANAEIKDLTLIDPNVSGDLPVGALVGGLWNGTINGCSVEGGSISGNMVVGGLVGDNRGTISNCYATGNVTATGNYIGGLAGINFGTVSDCNATGTVSGNDYVGGLVGWNYGGTILNCYATGTVYGLEENPYEGGTGGLVGTNCGTISDCNATGSVTGISRVGGLVGENGYNDYNGTITNCYADGSVSGNECVGGLVGSNGSEYYDCVSTISDCYATGSVDGNDNSTGGLVGRNWSGTISNCYATGTVSGEVWGTGGLVGSNGSDYRNATITNCYATGSVDGNCAAGGLVGSNWCWDANSTISYCYATGAVNGNDYVGGLVGKNGDYGLNSVIMNCYATGSVTGRNWVGGLVGYFSTELLQYECVIIRCYSIGSVIGENYVGGLAGDGRNYCVCYSFWDIETSGQTTSSGGTGKTTAEMKTASTYFGWSGCGDEGIWTIDEGNDYPHLAWEGKPGQPIPHISDFFEGSGMQDDPYQVSTAEQLNLIGLFTCELDKHFILVNDIDLAEFTGTQFNRIRGFTGVFDGNGHKVWNFTWDSNSPSVSSDTGLFRYLRTGGQIKNLGLENVDVNAINGSCVGGLVGLNLGTITNCYSTGSVTGGGVVGGLVGRNYGTITNCYSTSSVTAEEGYYDGGGVGGLVGHNFGDISNSYAAGAVDGNENTGGLVGQNGAYSGQKYYPGYIYNCYSTGEVIGSSDVGGLVGLHIAGEIGASFWDVNTSGQTISAGGTGLPTAQMQNESTFTDAGWDFVCETENGTDEVWTIDDGNDYPKLVWDVGCFPYGHEDYDEWLVVGKPLCWCCPRQCHGDVDNTAEYIKGKGYYHVHFKDLNVLLTAWNIKEPPDGLGIAWPDPNICADFDHDTEYIENKGYYRVHFNDLNILLKYWNVKEPPDGPGIEPNCLDCP